MGTGRHRAEDSTNVKRALPTQSEKNDQGAGKPCLKGNLIRGWTAGETALAPKAWGPEFGSQSPPWKSQVWCYALVIPTPGSQN